MRVLFVSGDFFPVIGGISLMVHGLAEACVDLGHDVTVLAPGARHETDAEFPYTVLRDSRRQPGNRQRLARLLYHYGAARELRKVVLELKPDLILLGVYKTYAGACLRIGRECGIPVGGLVHGLEVLSVLVQQESAILRRIRRATGYPTSRERVLAYLQQADRIFANSSVTSQHVEQRSGRKPITVGCGVPESALSSVTDWAQARAGRSQARARLGLSEAPTIGFVGRLVARKNVEAILESLNELQDCNAIIIGDGPMREAWGALAEELGVDARVTFTGEVEESVKWEYFRAMDVFCLPSRDIAGYNYEGFGIVFLEATVAGIPVVGGRSGGIPDVVEHERTGLLADPEDSLDVARCLRRMLEDHELAARCVAAAQARLHGEFNWKVIARRIIDELRPPVRSVARCRQPAAGS